MLHVTRTHTSYNYDTSYEDFDIVDHSCFITDNASLLMKTLTVMTNPWYTRSHQVILYYDHDQKGSVYDDQYM